ncbi:hypothetical protein RHMOL_Rhmol09G0165800 [Rhododendron molle]|uniref:Uncharacterized protein n=1 Tax=Rhododendron molle TaxID=49168 RepID=A0ACC0MEA2_RHOML|nr:hypothetical protein RHMOL_Rhmol09G0165800 [Rhododendron molle]
MEFTCEDFKVGKCKGQKLVDGVTMPLVLQPPEEPKNSNDMQSLLLALEKNNDWFKQIIIKNSAVLLRGFNVRNAEDFNDIVESFGWDHVPYVGPAPRTNVFKRIWTANEGPLSEPIIFHHEMALTPLRGQAEPDLAALQVGDVDAADLAGRVAGGLVEGGGDGGAVRDLMELLGIEVVEEDVEAEGVFNDRERLFGCERGHGGVGEDEDGEGLAVVDLAVDLLRLGEVTVEEAVFWEV